MLQTLEGLAQDSIPPLKNCTESRTQEFHQPVGENFFHGPF